MSEREKLIEIKDLQITFGGGRKKFVAVDHVNIDIYKGETFSLVGESGSGKTTIGRAVIRVNPLAGGEIDYKGVRHSGKSLTPWTGRSSGISRWSSRTPPRP